MVDSRNSRHPLLVFFFFGVGGPCLQNLVRDPWSSPPTAAELASLDLVYVKDRVIAMGFPVDKRSPEAVKGDATAPAPPRTPGTRAGNDIDLVAALLRSRHAGHYMVWNVSEEGYDYSLFQDQVCRRLSVFCVAFFFGIVCPGRSGGRCNDGCAHVASL